MTAEEVIALLDVQEPTVAAWTSKDGTKRNDDGDAIDPRQLEPWVWALGPFGSWPETLATASERIRSANHAFLVAESKRIGPVVMGMDGFGWARRSPEVSGG